MFQVQPSCRSVCRILPEREARPPLSWGYQFPGPRTGNLPTNMGWNFVNPQDLLRVRCCERTNPRGATSMSTPQNLIGCSGVATTKGVVAHLSCSALAKPWSTPLEPHNGKSSAYTSNAPSTLPRVVLMTFHQLGSKVDGSSRKVSPSNSHSNAAKRVTELTPQTLRFTQTRQHGKESTTHVERQAQT